MSKLKEYSDKFLLISLLILLACLFMEIFFKEDHKTTPPASLENAEPFEFEAENGYTVLIPGNSHQLMPGDIITVQEANGSDVDIMEIRNVVFRKRAAVSVILENGEEIEGRLTSQDDLNLKKDWKKLRQPLSVAQNRKIINISFSEVGAIKSDHKVFFNNLKDIDLQDFSLSFYQPKKIKSLHLETPERPEWEKKSLDNNETKYDLFTPPIIYLVDGKLTNNITQETLLPEKNEEKFGMELIRFSNEPYPYKLVSWIGETPYFEDTETRNSPTSSSFVRNRIEVGIPYKKNTQRQRGQPSLVPSTMEENEKQLMVEKFVVQQYKDEKTGGMKIIGRALVKDFKLGGQSFEINNQMSEVYAGNIKIEVRMTLNELKNKIFTFTTSDTGISFDFGDRVYSVTEIDQVAKTILVRKKGPSPDQEIEKLLSLP